MIKAGKNNRQQVDDNRLYNKLYQQLYAGCAYYFSQSYFFGTFY